MKTRPLKNYYGSIGCEVYDIDLATCSDEEIIELGHIVVDQCNVLIDKECFNGIPRERQGYIQSMWGQAKLALMHEWVKSLDPVPEHWKPLVENLDNVARQCPNVASNTPNMTAVTFERDDDDKPKGVFTNKAILDWHQDQASLPEPPRINGLASQHGSKGSRTDFLQTHDVWESLSSDMQSELKELRVKHVANLDGIAYGLRPGEEDVIRMNMVPLDGSETYLYTETANGRPGIRFPAFSFNGFVGMSDLESWKLYSYLTKLVYDPRYIYQHEWEDGQIMYFDQSICMHRRPTLIEDSPDRLMTRIVTLVDKLYPHTKPYNTIWVNGEEITYEEYFKLVDEAQKERYFKQKAA